MRIADLAVIAGQARDAEIAEMLAWARVQRPMLEATWATLDEHF